MNKLPYDPYFRVESDTTANSPQPDKAIWNAMHQCKTYNFAKDDYLNDGGYCQSIIKNALNFGHWSVLDFAFAKIDFGGFPHDTAMQWVRHQGASPMCQSMRYADEVFTDVKKGIFPVREAFYLPEGKDYEEMARKSCSDYVTAVGRDLDKEVARRLLVAGYRQNFTISASYRQWMHILDQRLLSDTQAEAQVAGRMALEELEKLSDLFKWYRENRGFKNKLAP